MTNINRSSMNSDPPTPPQHNTFHLFIIYGLVVIYALCYQLQTPLEPFLVDELLSEDDGNKNNNDNGTSESEAAAVTYGRFKSYFSMTQSIGSLVFGYILDKWGVRTGLVVNFLSCAACYYILSITDSISMLYMSRLPGIFMAGFLAAQTAIIKLTKVGPERLKALGRLTSAYTVGGIVGPALGGHLGSNGDYFIGAKFATGGSLVAAALVFTLPASIDMCSTNSSTDKENTESPVKDENEKAQDETEEQSSTPPTTWIQRALSIIQLVWLYLFVKIITSVANSMAKSAQPLILKGLGVEEAEMGMVMSAQFAFGGFANAFLLGPVTKLMGGVVSLVVGRCVIIMGVAYCVQALLYTGETSISHLQYPFIAMIMLLSIFQYSLGTSITTETSSLVLKYMQGTLMGMEHSLFAVAYIAGPQLGVAGLTAGGISGLSAMCASIFGAVYLVWRVFEMKVSSSSSSRAGEIEMEKCDVESLLRKSTPHIALEMKEGFLRPSCGVSDQAYSEKIVAG